MVYGRSAFCSDIFLRPILEVLERILWLLDVYLSASESISIYNLKCSLRSFVLINLLYSPVEYLIIVTIISEMLNILSFQKYVGLFCNRIAITNKVAIKYVSYVQGQSPKSGLREYFYYIDHQGMLFLDDSRMKNFTSCFKDKVFLEFFFKRLKFNTTDRYQQDFPYVSLCGRERNYVRCDDYPIVFTNVKKNDAGEDIFCYNHAGDLLSVKFMPEKIYMSPESGRVYHPAPDIVGGIGLVRSKLAIEFSQYFQFRDGEHESPTHFTWKGKTYELSPEWYKDIKKT